MVVYYFSSFFISKSNVNMFIMFSFDLVAKSPSASTRSFRATVFPLNIYEILKILFDPKKSWQHDSFEVEILLSECLRKWRNFHFAKAKFLWYFCHLDLFLHHYYQIKTPLKWSKKFLKQKMKWISWKVGNGFAILIQTSDLGTINLENHGAYVCNFYCFKASNLTLFKFV